MIFDMDESGGKINIHFQASSITDQCLDDRGIDRVHCNDWVNSLSVVRVCTT